MAANLEDSTRTLNGLLVGKATDLTLVSYTPANFTISNGTVTFAGPILNISPDLSEALHEAVLGAIPESAASSIRRTTDSDGTVHIQYLYETEGAVATTNTVANLSSTANTVSNRFSRVVVEPMIATLRETLAEDTNLLVNETVHQNDILFAELTKRFADLGASFGFIQKPHVDLNPNEYSTSAQLIYLPRVYIRWKARSSSWSDTRIFQLFTEKNKYLHLTMNVPIDYDNLSIQYVSTKDLSKPFTTLTTIQSWLNDSMRHMIEDLNSLIDELATAVPAEETSDDEEEETTD